MFGYFSGDNSNPNLGSYFTVAKEDALGILGGLGSSGINVASLLTLDLPEFMRRRLRNKIPFDLVKVLIDRLPAKDYNYEGNPEVFLRCGYLTGASAMHSLRKAFGPSWGINSHQYDFYDNMGSLSDRLLVKVERAKNDGKEAYLLGHSFGGLIGLQAFQKKPELFDKIVTMAVPYHGSEMADKYWRLLLLLPLICPPALLLPSIDVRKFKTSDPELAEFRRKGLPEDVPILNICSDGDEYVKPWGHGRLPEQNNVTNIRVPGVSHNGFLYNPMVREIARMFLNGEEMDYRMPDRLDRALGFKQTARIEELVRVNDF